MDDPSLTSPPNQSIPVVSASALQKTFRLDGSVVEVLKNIDLVLSSGKSVAIVGPSGAGKSTLLHILGLLDKPTGGTYMFTGKDVTKLSEQEKAHLRLRHIGFIFQFHHLLPEFTAAENVMLPALMLGKPKAEANAKALELLELVGLANRSVHRPGELSGGEQQRVALARALVNSPSLILADEPTGNLDSDSATLTSELLQSTARQNNSVLILVTHNHKLARQMDEVLVMESGRLAAFQAAT